MKLSFRQARIKKIMQADEDVGKIALAVPVLVCELLSLSSTVYFILQGSLLLLLCCLQSSL